MISKKITVKIATASDARPTAMLVQIASQYESKIHITCENRKFNVKSIMGMMTLGLRTDEELTVEIVGDDEEAAMESIEKFLTNQQ